MPRTRSNRNKTQAEYQRAYRAEQKAKRKPSRDDVARVALHWMILHSLGKEPQHLDRLRATIVARLAVQGFDHEAAAARLDELIDRYEEGWDFQRKPHLPAAAANAEAESEEGR